MKLEYLCKKYLMEVFYESENANALLRPASTRSNKFSSVKLSKVRIKFNLRANMKINEIKKIGKR